MLMILISFKINAFYWNGWLLIVYHKKHSTDPLFLPFSFNSTMKLNDKSNSFMPVIGWNSYGKFDFNFFLNKNRSKFRFFGVFMTENCAWHCEKKLSEQKHIDKKNQAKKSTIQHQLIRIKSHNSNKNEISF